MCVNNVNIYFVLKTFTTIYLRFQIWNFWVLNRMPEIHRLDLNLKKTLVIRISSKFVCRIERSFSHSFRSVSPSFDLSSIFQWYCVLSLVSIPVHISPFDVVVDLSLPKQPIKLLIYSNLMQCKSALEWLETLGLSFCVQEMVYKKFCIGYFWNAIQGAENTAFVCIQDKKLRKGHDIILEEPQTNLLLVCP